VSTALVPATGACRRAELATAEQPTAIVASASAQLRGRKSPDVGGSLHTLRTSVLSQDGFDMVAFLISESV